MLPHIIDSNTGKQGLETAPDEALSAVEGVRKGPHTDDNIDDVRSS